MIELLAPAGSPDALHAAVSNGADAVYLGGGDFNARRNAKNFSEKELCDAITFCHDSKVKVFLTMNTLQTDREILLAAQFARRMSAAGVDAFIVQDMGVAGMLRAAAPDVPRHASTQMCIHNLEGVRAMETAGFSRVILARELNKYQIAYICKNTSMEIEVFAHGALCMSYSGQCYMSALIGRRSGNRGMCAQPCRMQYTFGGSMSEQPGYPLSLRDLCLADKLTELEDIGVSSVKLEGRMRSAAYVAAVTGTYARLIDERRAPNNNEKRILDAAFSRNGFTNGYYEDKKGPEMFGVRGEAQTSDIKAKIYYRRDPEMREKQYSVVFYCVAQKDKPLLLAAEDDAGNRVSAAGAIPATALTHSTTEEDIKGQLVKTGGTQWQVEKTNVIVDDGLSVPVSALNALRRKCIGELDARRKVEHVKKRREGIFRPGVKLAGPRTLPELTLSFTKLAQLTDDILAFSSPARIYLPTWELCDDTERAKRIIASGIPVAATLPRILHDDEIPEFEKQLATVRDMGVTHALAGNPGLFTLAQKYGMELHGDFGLNVYNSQAIKQYKELGLQSVTLSFELTIPQIRDLSKTMDTELIVYGRLPLMLLENCIVKNHYKVCGQCKTSRVLIDRNDESFPIISDYGCRNQLLNAHKLYLSDKLSDFKRLGLATMRMNFTTESAFECAEAIKSYLDKTNYTPPQTTRGLYYRGVL